MVKQHFDEAYGRAVAEQYERFFVPAIGAPLAGDLVNRARLRSGERVLDVACGTGVVARLASREVGATGTVDGLDVNPGMLAIARTISSPGGTIAWHEASAETIPLPSESYDVVLCQMGLQFMPDPVAALQEMRRVLVPKGRLLLSLPGPAGDVFAALAEVMGRYVGAEAAGFVHQVFSLHAIDELRRFAADAGFDAVSLDTSVKVLHLPPPRVFLWQYVQSTPLSRSVARCGPEERRALEDDMAAQWPNQSDDEGMILRQPIVVLSAQK